ncbi:preprotein translocase subunit SecG [Galbibacter orientalis]|uniref:Protein-export membrane protein SecG n=1 Tax=Galbibacter orientalis DSM 19592 TaxID=926559 RepID=I3C560_9FLAO|nr:preprotein translocase subunit SecG [Galbibacter orientalis]EIJ38753.1 protein translocase, SecG subunit [Galbibacter orientalis DSM 19592]
MSTFSIFLVLIIIVAFLLVLVIMVQNPKGGGLSSSFGGGGSQVVGGVKKTGDFLDKSTWTLATILVALILLSNITLISNDSTESKLLDGRDVQTTAPSTTVPSAEVPATATDSTDGQ